MKGLHTQVWVTSALRDEDVQKALVLCYSLRRAYTTRKIAVIASPKISSGLRQTLHYGFDYVFFLEEDRNSACLKLEDFAKLYSLVALRSYKKCAYLAPTMMALKSCDEIFAEETRGFLLLENDADTSVFLFKPSIKHFEVLMAGLRNASQNGTGIGSYIKIWMKNQYNEEMGFLHGKYNVIVTSGNALLGHESKLSLVNLLDYPNGSDIGKLENTGILGKLVATHWSKILCNNVIPLIESSMKIDPTVSAANEPFVAKYEKEPLAVVGMSCRYPNADNLEEFWTLLFEGQDGTSNPPPFRWLREECSRNPVDARKTNAGFLKSPVDEFDAKFFGKSFTISMKFLLWLLQQYDQMKDWRL